MLGKFKSNQLLLTLLLGAIFFGLVACGEAVPTTAPFVPTAEPTTIPPTRTEPPTPVPTATLAALLTSEWGSVKAIGAEVKASPDTRAATIEKLGGFTIVAWQRKLPDGSWLERAGGGWVQRQDVVVYGTESEARRGVPPPTVPLTPVPTYNSKPVPINNPAYTYAPISGPGSIPQLLTTAPAPRAATPTIGTPGKAIPTPTTVPPTATVNPRFTPPQPLPTARPGSSPTAESGL